MKDIILLYSGGMDSTVALYEHAARVKLAVSFDYGSKHNACEIAHAAINCKNLGIAHRVIRLDLNAMGFVSDLLLSGGEIPDGHYAEESMKQTIVPFRNGIMLSIVAGMAESVNCAYVMLSNHAGDHAIYPDCREEFVDAMNQAIKAGTTNNVQIMAPYTLLDKRAIALRGKVLKVPFEQSYSCYKGGEVHCGVCGTCVERKEALQGFDNTIYLG